MTTGVTNAHATGKAPVLLLTYRKPDFLAELHDVILRYAPPRLYIAHNPAADHDDSDGVNAVRETVRRWQFPFAVEYVFHPAHLGINDSLRTSLDHVFAREESLIVLEDDTVPVPAFFDFCNAMLERYRDSDEVGSIVGCNLGAARRENACFLAEFAVFYWGWATWASKWKLWSRTAIPWGSDDNGVVPALAGGREFFRAFLQKLEPDSITWDVKWGWVQALHHQKCILPGVNLVANKGFLPHGTFTNFTRPPFMDITAFDVPLANARPVADAGFRREYEERTAALIRQILAEKGVQERYDLP